MGDTRYLVIGDTMVDEYTYTETTRRSPENHNACVYDVLSDNHRYGGAANVFLNVKSLTNSRHGEVDYSGIVPCDYERFPALNDKIAYNYMQIFADECDMIQKNRIMCKSLRHQVCRIDRNKTYKEQLCQDFAENLDHTANIDKFKEYDCIIVSDYRKGTLSFPIEERLAELDCPVFIDTKDPDLARWRKLKEPIVKINSHEFENAKNRGVVPVVVTMGEHGSIYRSCDWHKDDIIVSGLLPIREGDTIGAGDSYLAGLAVGYMQNDRHIGQAMRYADFVARASVRHQGTYVVKPEDVEREENEHRRYRQFTQESSASRI